MSNASRDDNFVPTIIGVSSVDLETPTPIAVNPSTGAVLIDGTSLYANLDTRYLILDASNDPITDSLEITGDLTLKDSSDRSLYWVNTTENRTWRIFQNDSGKKVQIRSYNNADLWILNGESDTNQFIGLRAVPKFGGVEAAIIKGFSGQSVPILRVRDSSDNDLVYVDDNGNLVTFKGRRVGKTRITSPIYNILLTDEEIFANTDSNAITANLPAGVDNQHYRIINTGSSGNNVTVSPNGSEDLLGANSNFDLGDGESLIITYDTNDGWY